MEEKKNFTFVMSGEQRDAITLVAEIEDRSLSKIAEYFMWAGFELYAKERRMLSAYEVKELAQSYKSKLRDAGLLDSVPPPASAQQLPQSHLFSTGTGEPAKGSRAVKKDAEDMKRIARERIKQKKSEK